MLAAHVAPARHGRAGVIVAVLRDVYDEDVQPLVAHIGGIPVEETLAMAVPVIGAAYAALVPSVRARWRLWKRKVGRS